MASQIDLFENYWVKHRWGIIEFLPDSTISIPKPMRALNLIVSSAAINSLKQNDTVYNIPTPMCQHYLKEPSLFSSLIDLLSLSLYLYFPCTINT